MQPCNTNSALHWNGCLKSDTPHQSTNLILMMTLMLLMVLVGMYMLIMCEYVIVYARMLK